MMKKKKLNHLNLRKTTIASFQNQVIGGNLVDPTQNSNNLVCTQETQYCFLSLECFTRWANCPTGLCPSWHILCPSNKCPSDSPFGCTNSIDICTG